MVPIYHLVKKDAPTAPQPVANPETCQPPGSGICYLVTRSGLFKQVRNPFYDLRLKVLGVPYLEDLSEEVRLHIPKLPNDLLRQAEAFFRAVYELHHSEAIVVLLANARSGEWRLAIPKQSIQDGSLHVSYQANSVDIPDGFQPFGTIHSHAALVAFHSGTDDKDEVHSDGLHITIGNLDRPERSYAARWMIGGQAFKAILADVVEFPALPETDPAWLERIASEERPAVQDYTERLWHDPWDDDAPRLPEEQLEEYENYMNEMSERFLDRHAQAPRERTQGKEGGQACLPL